MDTPWLERSQLRAWIRLVAVLELLRACWIRSCAETPI